MAEASPDNKRLNANSRSITSSTGLPASRKEEKRSKAISRCCLDDNHDSVEGYEVEEICMEMPDLVPMFRNCTGLDAISLFREVGVRVGSFAPVEQNQEYSKSRHSVRQFSLWKLLEI